MTSWRRIRVQALLKETALSPDDRDWYRPGFAKQKINTCKSVLHVIPEGRHLTELRSPSHRSLRWNGWSTMNRSSSIYLGCDPSSLCMWYSVPLLTPTPGTQGRWMRLPLELYGKRSGEPVDSRIANGLHDFKSAAWNICQVCALYRHT